MTWDTTEIYKRIDHLNPELIELTDNYVIYSVKLSENEIHYFGYSRKWGDYNLLPTQEETKNWLIEVEKINVIAPKDIYYGKVLKESYHIPWYIFESFNIGDGEDFNIPENQTNLLIKIHVNESVDWGERGIVICSVWWKESPVMLIMKGGRGLRDAEEISITSVNLYQEMITWLNSFKKVDLVEDKIDAPQKRLSVFYNCFVESLIKKENNE